MAAGKAAAAAFLAALVAAIGAAPALAQSGEVYVVGDSLEVGTSPYLERYLPGVPLRVDADETRSSTAGVAVVRQRLRSSDGIVVFDLGTNDDPSQTDRLTSDLAAVAQLVGDRCLVVATIHRPPAGGVSYDGLNGVIESFAAGRPNTQLVDWRSYAAAHPELLYSDGVHPTASGYALRARLIAEGVQACVAEPGASAPAPGDAESQAGTNVFNKVQDLLRKRATAARLVAMTYLERLRALARAPGDGAAAFLITLAAVAPREPLSVRPANRRRSPPRRSR